MAETLDRPDELVTDEDFVAMLNEGRIEEGLTGLQSRYAVRIFHFVHGMLRDDHLAQDVTQEVFEKVLTKFDLYQPGTNFRAWLFEVARNQALSAMRSRTRLPRPMSSFARLDDDRDMLDMLPDSSIKRPLEEKEFMAAFARAVDELPKHYQTVFELCVRQGKPYQEAGKILNLPTGTVAIRIMRARKRLFGALSRHLDRLRRPPACFQ